MSEIVALCNRGGEVAPMMPLVLVVITILVVASTFAMPTIPWSRSSTANSSSECGRSCSRYRLSIKHVNDTMKLIAIGRVKNEADLIGDALAAHGC